MSLSRLFKKPKKTVTIKDLIESAMRSPPQEVAPMNSDDWIRISSLGSVCPREEVLRYIHSVPNKKLIGPDLGLTFEEGHAVHWMMQNKVMPATGLFVGTWRCTWCGESYGSIKDGLVPRPDACLRCGSIAGEAVRSNNRKQLLVRDNAFLFVEEYIFNNEYMVGGSPDGYIVDGDPFNFKLEDLIIAEFKSTSSNNFDKYKLSPDFMHSIQCQFYMWLSGIKRAKIIYINKGVFGIDGIIEHDVKYDQESLDIGIMAISTIRNGLLTGEVPDRIACSNEGCKRATDCNVSKQCFSGMYE